MTLRHIPAKHLDLWDTGKSRSEFDPFALVHFFSSRNRPSPQNRGLCIRRFTWNVPMRPGPVWFSAYLGQILQQCIYLPVSGEARLVHNALGPLKKLPVEHSKPKVLAPGQSERW